MKHGKLEEAETLWRRAFHGFERKLGPDHAHTLSSVNNLGVVLDKQGNLGEAEPLWRRALKESKRTLLDPTTR